MAWEKRRVTFLAQALVRGLQSWNPCAATSLTRSVENQRSWLTRRNRVSGRRKTVVFDHRGRLGCKSQSAGVGATGALCRGSLRMPNSLVPSLLAAALSTGTSRGASDPFVGTWKLDPSRSTGQVSAPHECRYIRSLADLRRQRPRHKAVPPFFGSEEPYDHCACQRAQCAEHFRFRTRVGPFLCEIDVLGGCRP
jgi:hypothetical protein